MGPGMEVEIRRLGVLFAAGLAILLWLASCAEPPLLKVSDLDRVEDGLAVRVAGIVADVHPYDSGHTSVLIADYMSGETAQLLVSPTAEGHAVDGIAIGDEVLAEGVISLAPPRTTVFVSSGGISVIAKAAFAMSVEMLCADWRLFEYDRLNVSGVVCAPPDDTDAWLTDAEGRYRIRLVPANSAGPLPLGLATVDATLLMDSSTLSLYLKVWSATPLST